MVDGRERWEEACARRLLGAIAALRTPESCDVARNHYQEALSIATDIDASPLAAHGHVGLGKLYRRTGQREQAREHLTVATTMYREMDLRFWLEQAEAEVRELA